MIFGQLLSIKCSLSQRHCLLQRGTMLDISSIILIWYVYHPYIHIIIFLLVVTLANDKSSSDTFNEVQTLITSNNQLPNLYNTLELVCIQITSFKITPQLTAVEQFTPYSYSFCSIESSDIFYSNSAKEGGAVATNSGRFVIIDSLFRNNVAHNYGGANYSQDAVLSVIKTCYNGNTAKHFGGALYSTIESALSYLTVNSTIIMLFQMVSKKETLMIAVLVELCIWHFLIVLYKGQYFHL